MQSRWLSECQKPSKYFCSLEKHYYTEKNGTKIVTENGKILTDQTKILDEFKEFYRTLFCSRDAKISDYCANDLNTVIGLTKLTENESSLLQGYLTIEEIPKALKSMKNQKCPGVDEFPAEFFKVFWEKLKYFILRSLNGGYSSGQLSISLR